MVCAVIIGNNVQKDNLYNTAFKNVAEARYFMKSANTQTMSVQFIMGKREDPYTQNGVAEASTNFALVNIDGDHSLKDFSQIEGTIKIGNDLHPITLLQNPYNALNFSYDIIKSINREVTPDESVEVTLFIDTNNHPSFILGNTMEANAISWDRALRVAVDKVGDKIKNQKFESYITIIDNMAQDSGAFWYVQFITQDGKTHYVVVSPDGAVISR